MVVLGVVILVLAAVLAVGVVTSNGSPVDAEAFGITLDGVTVGGFFLVGVATGALALCGLVMALGGLTRRRAKRRALKQQVREVRSERETLAEENARLQTELGERQQADRTDLDDGTYPARSDASAVTRERAVAPDENPNGDATRGRHRLIGR